MKIAVDHITMCFKGLFNLAYVIQKGQWPVEPKWIDFSGISLGNGIQSNLTLATQLYDLLVTVF